MARVVGAAVVVTVSIVFLFVFASYWVGRELVAQPAAALNIDLTAQRPWGRSRCRGKW
jgi:hypothetical protein